MLLMTAYAVVLLTYLVGMACRVSLEQVIVWGCVLLYRARQTPHFRAPHRRCSACTQGVSERMMEQGFVVGGTVVASTTTKATGAAPRR